MTAPDEHEQLIVLHVHAEGEVIPAAQPQDSLAGDSPDADERDS